MEIIVGKFYKIHNFDENPNSSYNGKRVKVTRYDRNRTMGVFVEMIDGGLTNPGGLVTTELVPDEPIKPIKTKPQKL